MLLDFNLKQILKELKAKGKPLPKEYLDLGLAFWLINPDEKDYSPENLSRRYLHEGFDPLAGGFSKLFQFAEKKLKGYKLEKLFHEVEMPLVEILADMELAGIKLDLKHLKDLDKKLEKQLTELAKDVYKKTKNTFNLNSPKQLGDILFNKLKIDLGGVKKTRGGAISTDVDTLLTIKDRHPVVPLILEYRELFKLHSTYVRPLQELADANGRVHTTYIQTGTATGRLSSQNPNLQNIPAVGEWAKEVRKAFIAEKGFKLAALDYSQIELRILASLSSDPNMMEAFNNDVDIHKLTASQVFKVPLEKVTPDMRRLAKTLNFGVSYGMGANAFAKTSGLSVAEAKKFIQDYFANFKKVREWQEETKAQARQQGFVTNLNGRRRLTLEASSMYSREAGEAERAAINMPVQGLAADILKMAMVKIQEEFKGNKDVRLLLTIHDELLFEIKENKVLEAVKEIKKIMESAYELEVPIRVEAKTGVNWGELTNLK
ncbi:MAG: DNA polymerase [bacterium]|nr:DNA polymerase [bacterium]